MTQYNQNYEREIEWQGTLTEDAKEYVLLPPGFYKFKVIKMEKGRHEPNPNNPNSKLPACNKATLTIHIEANEGEAELKHNLFLHSSTEGMISAFFGAIGQKKKGQPFVMNWNNILNATGVCKVGTKTYRDNTYNEVKQMVYSDDVVQAQVLNNHIMPQTDDTSFTTIPAYQQQVPIQPQQQPYGSQPNPYQQQTPVQPQQQPAQQTPYSPFNQM